jgi:hypothetical protein
VCRSGSRVRGGRFVGRGRGRASFGVARARRWDSRVGRGGCCRGSRRYERNKHIFPASRWEVYDPHVKRDRYTIHGDEVEKEERKL